ncbi:hypothetical protein P7C73_g6597, partial [Tremellales sp. Uapishka_1]
MPSIHGVFESSSAPRSQRTRRETMKLPLMPPPPPPAYAYAEEWTPRPVHSSTPPCRLGAQTDDKDDRDDRDPEIKALEALEHLGGHFTSDWGEGYGFMDREETHPTPPSPSIRGWREGRRKAKLSNPQTPPRPPPPPIPPRAAERGLAIKKTSSTSVQVPLVLDSPARASLSRERTRSPSVLVPLVPQTTEPPAISHHKPHPPAVRAVPDLPQPLTQPPLLLRLLHRLFPPALAPIGFRPRARRRPATLVTERSPVPSFPDGTIATPEKIVHEASHQYLPLDLALVRHRERRIVLLVQLSVGSDQRLAR